MCGVRQEAVVEFWLPEMPKEEMTKGKKIAPQRQEDRKVCLLLLKVIRVVGSY